MATTPDRTRFDKPLYARTVAAADTVVPTVDTGADVIDWDQVLLVISGNATGSVELLLFKQWALFYAAFDVDKMIPGSYVKTVPIMVSSPFTPATRGVAAFLLNTTGCDRIFPSILTLTGATAAYVSVFGMTRAGEPLLPQDAISDSATSGGAESLVNLREIGGVTVVTGGVNGTLGVGGLAAHGAAAAGNPVLGGAKANAADPTDVAENAAVNLSATLGSRLRVQAAGVAAHGAAVAGNPQLVGAKATAAEPGAVTEGTVATLSTTLAGRLRVDALGNVAHDAADSGNPVKIGFKAVNVLPADVSATSDRADGISDLKGIQYVRDGIAGDSVAAANRVSSNTIADDRDEAPQTWLSVTDDATDPDYGPSSAGYEVGNRTKLSFELSVRDGVVTFEESELGSSWVDVTTMVLDRATGAGGYASFSEPDSATVVFKLELTTGARYVRAKWNPNNATSIIVLSCTARVV